MQELHLPFFLISSASPYTAAIRAPASSSTDFAFATLFIIFNPRTPKLARSSFSGSHPKSQFHFIQKLYNTNTAKLQPSHAILSNHNIIFTVMLSVLTSFGILSQGYFTRISLVGRVFKSSVLADIVQVLC
jgi:hypothetical protein